MDISQTLTVINREEWRAWLEQHHASTAEIWLIIYKRQSGIPCLKLEEAVEEALCFGWIDGILKPVDEQRYALRFTPRKNDSNWSALNKRRALKLVRAGRMTEAGLAKITFPLDETSLAAAQKEETRLPEALEAVLKANPAAWENFQNLPPSHKGRYIGWICSAKGEATRLKRTTLATQLLEYNLRLGMENPSKMLEMAKAAKKE
jgi:uncharacterized protein YdeI (YjbR/CyaY-like superfamily)